MSDEEGEAPKRPPGIHQPWHRQPREGEKAYAAFLRYRDLPPRERSVAKATGVKDLPKTARKPYYSWWKEWSAKWHWRDRCRAWDEHQQEKAQKAADKVLIEAAIRKAEQRAEQKELHETEDWALRQMGRSVATRILEVVQGGGLNRLTEARTKSVRITRHRDGTVERIEDERKSILEMAGLAVQAIEIGQKLERLDSGQPTERSEVTGKGGGPVRVSVEGLSDDELLARIRAILEPGAAGGT